MAAKETKEYYDEIARRYPGIKASFYWSNTETHGAIRQCKLSNNPTVLSAYKKAIASPYFLSSVGDKSPVYFADIKYNTISAEKQKLSAFASINGRLDIGKVAYKINGKYIGEATGSPYEINYDFSSLAGRDITIQADIYTTGNAYVTTENIKAKVGGRSSVKPSIDAKVSTHSVTVDDIPVEISGYAIGGHNYYKLRDLAYALRYTDAKFDVGYDQSNNRIIMTRSSRYKEVNNNSKLNKYPNASKSTQSISIDGNNVLGVNAYTLDSNNYFKLVDLAKDLNFRAEWNNHTKTVMIQTK